MLYIPHDTNALDHSRRLYYWLTFNRSFLKMLNIACSQNAKYFVRIVDYIRHNSKYIYLLKLDSDLLRYWSIFINTMID